MMSFRPLEKTDFPLLLEWLQLPHVKEWWDDGDDTLEKVTAHYSSDPDSTFRFIIQSESVPIGYIQYYLLNDRTVGMDLFIAKSDYLNRGVGTASITSFVEMLGKEAGYTKFVIDPAPDNLRAIRCYEKAGFLFDRVSIGDNGKPAYFMSMERDV